MVSEFPLFLFTTLGGLSAGVYAASAVFPINRNAKKPWVFPLVCGVLLFAGLIGLPAHLGHPERMLAALAHPGAMIAQEAYWSAALGIVIVIDLVLCVRKGASPRGVRVVGAVAALGLTCVMANAYFVSYAVAAWSSWQTFPLYICGNLAMGAAFAGALENSLIKNKAFVAVTLVCEALAAVAFALEIAHFASVGVGVALLVAGVVFAVASAAFLLVAHRGKMEAKTASWVAFACMFVGVAAARYGFYAAFAL